MSISKEELRTLISESVHKEIDRHIQPSQPQPSQPKEAHADHVCGCKDCLCDTIDKLKKTSEAACEKCHMPLGKKQVAVQIDHCPMCGHKKAQPYRWDFENNKPVYG